MDPRDREVLEELLGIKLSDDACKRCDGCIDEHDHSDYKCIPCKCDSVLY